MIQFLLDYNIYIGLAAVSLTIETGIILKYDVNFHPYLALIFFATIIVYNISRLSHFIFKPGGYNRQRLKYIYIVTIVSVAGIILSMMLIRKEVFYILIPAAVITFLYSYPPLIRKKYIVRLRDVPFFKIFLIAVTWTVSTVLFPVFFTGGNLLSLDITVLFLERLIFILAITIPFDIRDMESDKLVGLKTFPLLIGKERSILVSNILLGLFLIVTTWHYFNRMEIVPGMIISGVSTLYFINNKALIKRKNYYYGILDGTMLLQGLLVVAAYFLQNK